MSPNRSIELDLTIPGYVNEEIIESEIDTARDEGRAIIPSKESLARESNVPGVIKLAHEIGHNVGLLSEEAVIGLLENTIRREFNIEPRTTYGGEKLDFLRITDDERRAWRELIGQ